MKKVIWIVLITLFLLPVQAFAQTTIPKNPTIVVDGKILYCDVHPFIEKGRVMVPLRPIFDALDGKLNWIPNENRVTGFKGAYSVNLVIGNTTAFISGNKEVTLDVPAKIVGGRTFVPLRFVSESLGATVEWNSTEYVATITSSKTSNVQDISKLIIPTVVLITTDRGFGTGFFFNIDGAQYIITNAHVVEGAKWIKGKTFDQIEHNATVIMEDSVLDLARLSINNVYDYNYIQWYTPMSDVSVGDQVIAIGSPLGLENSVTTGVISAIRGSNYQISAPIYHGSSGGPLLDENGCVVGITSAGIEEFQGANFAIPIDYVFNMQNRPRDFKQEFLAEYSKWTTARNEILTKCNEANNYVGREDNDSAISLINQEILPGLNNLINEVNLYQPQTQEISNIVELYKAMLKADYNWEWNYAIHLISGNQYSYTLSEQFRIKSNSYANQLNIAISNI